MKLLFALIGALPGLALLSVAPHLLAAAADIAAWLIVTPAGPILAAVAILGQAPRPAPRPAAVIDYTDREYLAFLLAQEVRHGA